MVVSFLRTNNRLYRLLTGGSRAGWATTGWGMAASSMAYASLAFLPRRAIFTGAWATLVVGAAVVGWVAARLTEHALQRSGYQMLRLADLPPAEVVQGFVLAALYRLRFVLGWLLGVSPLLVLSSYLYAYQGAAQRCFAYVSRRNWAAVVHEFGFTRVYRLPEPVRCVAPDNARLVASTLAHTPIPAALGCLVLLLAVLGVAVGLARSRASTGPVIGLVGTALAALLAACVARLLKPALQAPVFCQPTCTYILPWPPDLPMETGLMVLFALAAWGVLRLARRWV
jgi:hypothetical protein